ncbi:NAD(P)-dependent oxidoreductase [Lichenihabitans sp. Uapishka_5]|uniref:NAD-dependent epimerase/dehydratase family protein n=1 Tax=Lichenihabitans sp. Uapishka_5 TaxID=3037302 RepID=UPI0029E81FE7|nr:NAD(P)-dependent oxidoreductase [Lichenihabitans sp. Uapishka_5]MDX7952566.1 NAD(P)-dependent oxidoreductase [Lichenihabitans sp. Uapishka_5]
MPEERPLILLTGGSGRVGRMLRPLLRQRFDLRVNDIVPVDDMGAGETALTGDLADPIVADAAVRGVDGVVHLAGLVAPDVAFADTLAPNYTAVLNLLEACRRHDVRRFVFASSHHILGLLPSSQAYDDHATIAPDGFYALSKAFGEAACAMYAHRYGIATLVVRIGNADPEIVDGRRERMWTSAVDLARLIGLGLTAEGLTYEVSYGVSTCPDPLFPQTRGPLGYRPVDEASLHRSADFRELSSMGTQDGVGFVGGLFAVTDLPGSKVGA